MLNKEWKILNPKHRGLCPRPRKPRKGLILNKFKCLNSKFKTNLSKESFTKERFAVFVIGILVIWYCLGFRVSNL